MNVITSQVPEIAKNAFWKWVYCVSPYEVPTVMKYEMNCVHWVWPNSLALEQYRNQVWEDQEAVMRLRIRFHLIRVLIWAFPHQEQEDVSPARPEVRSMRRTGSVHGVRNRVPCFVWTTSPFRVLLETMKQWRPGYAEL